MNLALTGVPLGLFILFSITVFIFSLVVGLVLGLLAAVLFTLFCVGVALSIVFPFIFFTTLTACFLFLWGLGGYYLLKWVNSDDSKKPAPEGAAIGDKLNSLTGGRLSGFLDSARAERSKDDISGFDDKNTKPEAQPAPQPAAGKGKPHANGSAGGNKKHDVGSLPGKAVTSATESPSAGVRKAAAATGNPAVNNVAKKGADTTGTVKGGLSGATGLL